MSVPATEMADLPAPHELSEDEELNLIREVEAELADPDHATRTHGRVSGYDKGCRGPLCRMAKRRAKTAWYQRTVLELRGELPKEYAPRPSREYDALLEAICEKHWRERGI